MRARGGRPLLLLDIAVPRDVDPACAELPGVTLFDIDGLQARSRARTSSARDRGAARRGDRRGGDRALRRVARRRSRCCRRSRRCARRPRGSSSRAARRERRALGGRSPARPRARRGDARAAVNRLLHEPTSAAAGARRRARHGRLQLAARAVRARRGPAAPRRPSRACRQRPRRCVAARSACGIATRGSALALAQARWVAERLDGRRPSSSTIDDVGRPPPRASATRSAGSASSRRRCWPARPTSPCTSAKDVPVRAAPRASSSSPRRRARTRATCCAARRRSRAARGRARRDGVAAPRAAAARAARPDLEVVELRGNVDTRLRKLADGEVDAIVLAAAGLARLGRGDDRRRRSTRLVPAAGPGHPRHRGARRRRAALGAPTTPLRDAAPRRRWRERALVARPRRRLPHAGRRARRATPTAALRCARSSACPDGSAWLTDEVRAAPTPERLGERAGRASGCSPPARAEVLGAMSAASRLPRRRRPGRSRAADRARARAHRARRRRPARPADPARGARRRAAGRGAASTSARSAAGSRCPQDETERLLVEHARAGQRRRAPEGRRPVRLRPRRRGGAACCARPASPFEVVPGVTAGRRRARLRRHPGHAPRRVERGRVRHRPRGPGQAGDRRSTGRRSRAFPGTLVFYMGVRAAAADRRAARSPAGGPPTSRRRSSSAARSPTSARGRDARRRCRSARPRRASARRRSPSSGRSRRCATSSRWFERRPLRGRSVVVTRARAAGQRARRAAARARRDGRRGAGDPHRAARRRAARPRAVRPGLRDLAQRRRARCSRRPGATRARSPARRSRRSGRARRARCARAASAPTSCPTARSPRGSSRRCAARDVARALVARGPRAATCCPTRCASAAPRSRCSRSTGRSPSRSTPRRAAAAPRADYVTFTSASTVALLPRRRRRAVAGRASSRSARRRAPRCASRALEPASRPTSTRPTGSSRRCSPTRARRRRRSNVSADAVDRRGPRQARALRRRPRRTKLGLHRVAGGEPGARAGSVRRSLGESDLRRPRASWRA